MDFEHTEDRRMLEDTLRRYLTEQYDITTRNSVAYDAQGYSPDKWTEMAELGIIGALFSEAEGGFGGAGFDIALVFEELGRALCPDPFLGALLGGKTLAAGNDDHHAKLDAVIDGSLIVALAAEEVSSYYDLLYVETSAKPDGQDWVLNGAKSVVPHAETAGLLIVTARISGDVGDTDGLGIFAVPADTNGLQVLGYNTIDGGRAGEVLLNSVTLPASALIARDGDAAALLVDIAGYAHLALSAEALGVMEVMKTSTMEYLQTRKQFGVTIGKFQVLQHRMVDLVLEIEQARSSVINAATLPADMIQRRKFLAAAKMTVSEAGTKVVEESIQMHGGIGMTWEMPLSHYAKRLTMIGHQFGDEDFHLAQYIALSKETAA